LASGLFIGYPPLGNRRTWGLSICRRYRSRLTFNVNLLKGDIMTRDPAPPRNPPHRYIIVGCILNILILVLCSFIQKKIAGYNPFLLKGYLIAVTIGALYGGILGAYWGKIKQLHKVMAKRVNNLESFLPICSQCKKIRNPDSDPNDHSSWIQMETYISQRTESQFSHSLCPECLSVFYGKYSEVYPRLKLSSDQ